MSDLVAFEFWMVRENGDGEDDGVVRHYVGQLLRDVLARVAGRRERLDAVAALRDVLNDQEQKRQVKSGIKIFNSEVEFSTLKEISGSSNPRHVNIIA